MPAGNPQGYIGGLGRLTRSRGPRNAIRGALETKPATQRGVQAEKPAFPGSPRVNSGRDVGAQAPLSRIGAQTPLSPTNPNRISSGPGIVPTGPRISSGPGIVPIDNNRFENTLFPKFQPAPMPTGIGTFEDTLNQVAGPANPENVAPDRGLNNGPQQLSPDFQNILSMILQDPNFLSQIFGGLGSIRRL